tara:strand:+ start:3894 stop:4175 length:282 start_codon:yes stop_codon:yes gene_type:complete
MFQKLKEFCRINKEKNMTTTTKESRATSNTLKLLSSESAHLKKKLANQSETMATLLSRMSILSDELALLKGELNAFKKNVSNDVKYLTDRVDS